MEWPSLVDLRPRIDRDYKHCYNSITNSDRQLATPGRGTSLVSRHAVRARPFRNFPPPHTSLSLSAMPLVVFPLGSGCPRRLLLPLALSQLLFRRHRLLALVMLLALPVSLVLVFEVSRRTYPYVCCDEGPPTTHLQQQRPAPELHYARGARCAGCARVVWQCGAGVRRALGPRAGRWARVRGPAANKSHRRKIVRC